MRLEFDNLFLTKGGKKILNGVSLSLSQFEIVGLFGRNGSGKSTLLSAIFGLVNPEYLTVRLNDARIDSSKIVGLASYLPQNGYLPASIDMAKCLSLFKLSEADAELIASFVKKSLSTKVYTLSYGEKKAFELLLLVFSHHPFLFLDEPFRGLSPIQIDKLLPIIKGARRKKGILLIDHNYRKVVEVCTRACVMENGIVKNLDSPSESSKYLYLSDNMI